MSDTIQLEIITSTEPAIKAGIRQIYLPAYLGMAGVLEDHKPYLSLLQPGEIFYTDIKDQKHYLYVREGFIEVNDNKVVIISDSVERGETLVEKKEDINARLETVNQQIKAATKMEAGMSSEDILAMPEKLQDALKEQQELETKQKIIRKLEDQK